jgi:hypothetical protein
MSRIFELHTEYPARKIGRGVLDIDRHGEATFLNEDGVSVLAVMTRAKLSIASRDVIIISGFEHQGPDRIGRQKLTYQEWILRYTE